MHLCWLFFFSHLISYSKAARKKTKKTPAVLCCVWFWKRAREKKSACCPHYQSTFALSDFRGCIIKS